MSNTSFEYNAPIVYDSDQEYNAYSPTSTAIPSPDLAHLASLVALGPDGSFVFLLQDSISEVVQSVEMICGTVVGERSVVPTFGIPDQTFTQPSKSQIVSAVAQWEHRATVRVAVDTNDPLGISEVKVTVTPSKGIGVLA